MGCSSVRREISLLFPPCLKTSEVVVEFLPDPGCGSSQAIPVIGSEDVVIDDELLPARADIEMLPRGTGVEG